MAAGKMRFKNGSPSEAALPVRRLRLSTLEIAVTGLIVVGLLYLVSMWMGWGYGPRPDPAKQTSSQALMEKALTASERVQAQIDVLRQEVAGLRAMIENPPDDLDGEAKAGARSNRKLTAWANSVGKRLAELDRKLKAPPPPAADPKLSAKVNELEKKLASLPKAGAKTPAGPGGADLANLENKFQGQIKALAKEFSDKTQALEKSLARAKPAAKGDSKALEKLAAGLGQLQKELDGRLNDLSRQVAANTKTAAAPADRVKQLAEKLDALAKQSGERAAGLDRRLQEISQQKPAPDPRLAQLTEKLGQMEKDLAARLASLSQKAEQAAKQGGAKPDKELAGLSQKLADLEKRLAGKTAAVPGPEAAGLDTRLKALEKGLEDERAVRDQAVRASMETISARLSRLEKDTQVRPTGALWPTLQTAELAKRLASLEGKASVKAALAGGDLAKRVTALEKKTPGKGEAERLAALNKRLADLEKKTSGTANSLWPTLQAAELGNRLAQVEKSLAAAPQPADPRKLAQLAARVEGLEKGLAQKPQGGPVSAQLAAKVAQLEKRQEGVLPAAQRNSAALDQMRARLEQLGKALQAAQKDAARPDPALARLNRQVEQLELRRKALEASLKRRDLALQKDVDKKLAGLAQEQQKALAKRVNALETQVTGVVRGAAGLGPGLSNLGKRLDRLEGVLADTRRRASPNANKITRLEDRLTALEGVLKDRGAVPPALLARLGRLEAPTAKAPANSGARLAVLSDRVENLERELRGRPARPAPRSLDAAPQAEQHGPPRPTRITHKVAPGETLFGLSRTYGVKVADIRRWNKMADNNLKAGTRIVIMQTAQ